MRLHKNKQENNNFPQLGEELENNDFTENFRKLYKRFAKWKYIYHEASIRYKKLDFWCFTIPLLALQIANAIIPVFLSSDDATLNKQVATTISAVSAAVIGLQAKMKLAEIGEKYRKIIMK